MGDVEVHDQFWTRSQLSLGGRGVQIVGSEMRRRYVHGMRLQYVDAHGAGVAGSAAGARIDELEPTAVGAQTELLGHQVRRLVGGGFPHSDRRSRVAVGVVLARTSPEPPQHRELGRQRERDADARQIMQRVGHVDHMSVLHRAVVGHPALPRVVHQLLGRQPVDTQLLPPFQRLVALRCRLAHQLEPVVVDGCPEQRQLDWRHQQVIDGGEVV